MEQASAARLRTSAALRVLAALLIAGAATAAGVIGPWGPLDVRTDVVGYPIFHDFNYQNYFRAYYLVIGFFPIAALLLFLGLTRIGPRIGLEAPQSRGNLRPSGPPHKAAPALEGEPALAEAPLAKRRAVGGARIMLVGAVLGLEAGIAADAIWPWLVLGLLIYGFAVLLVAAVLNRRSAEGWSLEGRLAAVNSIGASLTLAGLLAASASTDVRVLADGSVKSYLWLPAWIALPIAGVLATFVALALRRAGSATRLVEIERRALLMIAAPAGLLVLLQVMAGDLGPFDTFHYGEVLAGSRLVGDGFLPWRDVVLTHGVLQDVVSTYGQAVFGDSAWGWFAGGAMIMAPLYLISVYFLCVYLVGCNWLFLVLTAVLFVGTTLAPDNFRLILWPLILLVLAAVLNHPTALREIALAFFVVAQVILTPEAVPALVAIAAVLVLYEWYWRRPGASIAAAFPRTLWVGVAGIAFASCFAGYLAANGALDDYVYISTNLVHGHALVGGIPPEPNVATVSQMQFDFMALAPPAALLISFAYAVARLRLRRPFLTADWVMGAAAIFLLFYYPKFVSRMDTGHVYEPFVASLPLLLYIVYRAVTAIEGEIRSRWPDNPALRLSAHPVSLALVVLVAALSWGNLRDRVADAADRYRPAVAEKPQFKRVGYDESFDAVGYRDLRRVVDAYLGPNDRIFDFSNEPALFFYLMDRDPSTRYFHVSLAYSAELQTDLIDRLRRARPKLIAFDDTDARIFGLANWDGIPNMVRSYLISRWILDHYRPLLASHGHTFYARRDQPPPSKADLHLSQKPATHDVPFLTQSCTWGYAPSFLSGAAEPPPDAKIVSAPTTPVRNPQVTVTGWAGDPNANAPVREVIAAVGARIVGRGSPRIERPDLIAVGLPSGFERAGFRIQIPVSALHGPGELHLFAVARDGSVGELPAGTASPPQGSVRLGGRTIRLEPSAVSGHFDSTLGPASMQIEPPAGSRWADYRWLEVDAAKGGFRQGYFALFDRQDRPSPGREITFQTLDRSPDRYVVSVASCAQWHGYGSDPLFLAVSPQQDIAGVRLIR